MITTCVAAAGVTLMALEVDCQAAAGDSRACSRCAATVNVSPEKVAKPWLAVAVSVPPSVGPPGRSAELQWSHVSVCRRGHVAVQILDRRLQAESRCRR